MEDKDDYLRIPKDDIKSIIRPIYWQEIIDKHLVRIRTLEKTYYTKYGEFSTILN